MAKFSLSGLFWAWRHMLSTSMFCKVLRSLFGREGATVGSFSLPLEYAAFYHFEINIFQLLWNPSAGKLGFQYKCMELLSKGKEVPIEPCRSLFKDYGAGGWQNAFTFSKLMKLYLFYFSLTVFVCWFLLIYFNFIYYFPYFNLKYLEIQASARPLNL